MPAIHPFTSDAPLFYNVGVWGARGYGIPNFGKNESGQSLNQTIERFTTEGGMRISSIMHHSDSQRINPPSLNTVKRIISFINRARTVLVGRQVAENELKFEGTKVRGGRIPLRVFPCPFFKVDNRLMSDFAHASFACLAELFQSTENGVEHDITESLAEISLRYIKRFQRDMAMDYFGMTREQAEAADLNLATHYDKYTPLASGFVSGEVYDDTDTLSFPDEIDLGPLAKGILIMDLPVCGPYPYSDTSIGATAEGTAPSSGSTVPSFPESTA
jgi:hypothetical protein